MRDERGSLFPNTTPFALGAFANSWTATLTGDDSGLENDSHRQVIPAADASTSGDVVRVTFEASSVASFTVDNASIAPRDTGANATVTPTELKFDGASGFAITSGQTKVSDSLDFFFNEAVDHLVIADYGAANGNPRRIADGAGTVYTKVDVNSYADATVTGFTEVTTRTYHVNKIEVASY